MSIRFNHKMSIRIFTFLLLSLFSLCRWTEKVMVITIVIDYSF